MAEIQVGAHFGIGNLISRAAEGLESSGEVRLTGINFSVNKVIDVSEMLKHRIKNLHQINELESFEGKTRLTIILSTSKLTGVKGYYSAPIDVSQVEEKSYEELKTRPPRKEGNEEGNEGKPRRQRNDQEESRGRGGRRARGGRGQKRGRGGRERGEGNEETKKPRQEGGKLQALQKKLEEEKRESNDILISNLDIAPQ